MNGWFRNMFAKMWRSFPRWVDAVLFVNLLVILCLVGLATVCFHWVEGDIGEHIHDSFMVYQGQVPYRDFFEHHHPLLWYLSAPIVGLLERNYAVFGVMCYITFLFFVLGLVYVYKIVAEFLSGRTAALFSVIMLLIPGIFLYYAYFKPDNYMYTCLAAGIYYFFCYMRDKKSRYLVFSYLGVWVAFLFTQKALFYFPLMAVWSLWLLYKKEMRWRDVSAASALPLISGAMMGAYLLFNGMWHIYYQMNFAFNREMVALFEGKEINRAWDIAYIVFGAAAFSGIALYKFSGRYFRMWTWLFALSIGSKVFYFAPHVYYYYEAYFFAVPLAAAGVMKLAEQWKLLLFLVYIELQCYIVFIAMCFYNDIVYNYKKDVIEYLWENTDKDDYVLTGDGGMLFMFSKQPVYYWFIPGRLSVVGEKIGLHEFDDYNEAIRKYRPKFVWVEDVKNFFDEDEVVYKFDEDLIDEMYELSGYQRTEEFDFKTKKLTILERPQGLYRLKKAYELPDGKAGMVSEEESNAKF